MDVEQQRARGIAGIGRMHAAVGQLPDQPGIDGAERQFAVARALPGPRHVVQQPLQLGGGKIRIQHQSGLALDQRLMSLPAQLVAALGRTAVLPDDGAGHGLAGDAVPQHRGLALVGDADRDGGRARITVAHQRGGRPRQAGPGHGQLRLPDVLGVVLDPARTGEQLGELLLGDGDDLPGMIDQQGARTGRALVQRKDIAHTEETW